MKDIRIVIVSWNVEKLLEPCLRSLVDACRGLDWDVVLIDNASHDESVVVAKRVGEQYRLPLRVISNADNRGFARACNQGIADHDARYVLLLNCDTECPPDSLTRLVRQADACSTAGITGPKIIYPDGRYQESVRAFPSVWNQACILLRWHFLFPWLPTLKRYFCKKLDVNREQFVDQVMGACFLIRRELIDQIGGLDERYFIWFEEVDYCRQAIERGWKVLYAPSTSIIHHGGQSFGQLFSIKKQQMFNASQYGYFAKWMPGWRAMLIRCLQPVSIAIARGIDTLRNPQASWFFWLAGLIVLEALSLATVFHPLARAIATCAVGLIVFVLAYRKPALSLSMILLELLVGSKGALLKIPNGTEVDGGISLRVVMFIAFFVGWVVRSLPHWYQYRQAFLHDVRGYFKGRYAWLGLAFVCLWGLANGVRFHNPFLLADANAWFFLLLLFPVVAVAKETGEFFLRYAKDAITAALVWLPIKSVLLLYVFSHGIPWLSEPLYLWVRRTGVGEVTLITGNLFRLFIQSQVFGLFAFIIFIAFAAVHVRAAIKPRYWAIAIGSALSMIVGLSRSFWIGLAVGGVTVLVLMWRHRQQTIFAWISKILAPVMFAIGILVITVAFPIPSIQVGSLATLFGSRGSASDPAAASRWNLLPILMKKIQQTPLLGSGFGATVTYQSKDPRILSKNPAGTYTTYAFEWGWFEHWIKFGIFGIPVLLWLLASLIQRIWKTDQERWLRVGLIASCVGLATLHFFTPYLNHPLGFTVLLVLEGWLEATKSLKQRFVE